MTKIRCLWTKEQTVYFYQTAFLGGVTCWHYPNWRRAAPIVIRQYTAAKEKKS